jgi:CarboxypepD_reg-like domain/Gram-negative bacterial TonB protein C-terminal
MALQQNDIIYTLKDIKQYFDNELTPLQMNAMEKAALNDPFLAEAMEGYEPFKHKDFTIDLVSLKNNLNQQKQTAKIVSINHHSKKKWLAAAAILFIVSTIGINYWLKNNSIQPVQDIATINTPTPLHELAKPDSTFSNIKITDKKIAALPATKDAEIAGDLAQKINAEKASTTDNEFVYTPSPPVIGTESKPIIPTNQQSENLASPNPTSRAVPSNNAVADQQSTLRNNELNEVNRKESQNTQQQYPRRQVLDKQFFAQVVAPDNSPLPFANISVKSENFGTYADASGNFRLVSTDSIINIEIKSAGFLSSTFALSSSSTLNKIMLQEDKNVEVYKITTTGRNKISKKRNSALFVIDSTQMVTPVVGWDNYSVYIDNNLEIPSSVGDKNIHGNVEVTFDVNKNGTATDVKIDKSLCNECDEVAKKLVQQGPRWRKSKTTQNQKGRVVIKF